MTALNWRARENNPLVWDAEIDGKIVATIIGGTQKFEGKKTLEYETYACVVDDVSVGQQSSPAAAKAFCEAIIANKQEAPLKIDGELHLWVIVPQGPDRRAEGCIYGDPRFQDGRRITTGIILNLDWDADGDLIKTRTAYYRLCRQERTAALIALGVAAAREGHTPLIESKPDGQAQ